MTTGALHDAVGRGVAMHNAYFDILYSVYVFKTFPLQVSKLGLNAASHLRT